MVAWSLMGSACGARQPIAAAAHGSTPAPRSDRTPLPENPEGIIGGPADETAFEFDPEPEATPGPDLVLDGVPAPDREILGGLEPYLAIRRATLAGLAPGQGVLMLSRIDDVTQAYFVERPLASPVRITASRWPVAQAAFVPGPGRRLIYRADEAGSEDHQLFSLDDTGELRRLTDGRSRHGPFRVRRGGLVAYTGNQRATSDMDVYVRNLQRGRAERIRETTGQHVVLAWSRDGSALLTREFRSVDDSKISIVDLSSGRSRTLTEAGSSCVDGRFGPGSVVYVVCDRGGEFLRLFELRDRVWHRLSPDRPWDVEGLAVSPQGETVAFVVNDDGESALHTVSPRTRTVTRYTNVPSGVITRLVFASSRTLLFTYSGPRTPGDVFAYDVETGELVRWTRSSTGGLAPDDFELPERHQLAAADDVRIPVFVYRADGSGPHPVLVWIHGGPEEQFRPTFNPMIQYFVDSGISVVAPNIRGSDGYGRTYRSLDNGTSRHDAISDIGTVLDWIDADPRLDARRVGIHGGSYGGYVVLASLAQFGRRIVAGSNLVGIANFVTFLENTREYRRDLRRQEYGDERDPAIREYLERVSPLSIADEITSALLVAHGANDPRVPVVEAEAIVKAVRDRGNPAWFALAVAEGHSFRAQATRDAYYAVLASFFHYHLLDSELPDPQVAHEPDPVPMSPDSLRGHDIQGVDR